MCREIRFVSGADCRLGRLMPTVDDRCSTVGSLTWHRHQLWSEGQRAPARAVPPREVPLKRAARHANESTLIIKNKDDKDQDEKSG